MSKSIELRQQRAKVIEDTKAIIGKAETENRDLTSEEKEKFERMTAETTSLKERYERLDAIEAQEREIAASGNAYRDINPLAHRGGSDPKQDVHASAEYKRAMNQYLATGHTDQFRALNVGTSADGGYTVSTAVYDQITQALNTMSPVRKAGATVFTTKTNTTFPVSSVVTATWGTEASALNSGSTTDPTYSAFAANAFRLDVNTQVSKELLADSSVDIEASVASLFLDAIVKESDNAYTTGGGSTKPTGFMGTATAVTAASSTTFTAKELLNFFYSVPAQYRTQPSCAMTAGDTTIAFIAGLSAPAATTTWINFQPSMVAGEPDKLFGKPIYTAPAMDTAFTTGKELVACGAFKYYYVVDRINQAGFIRLNELFALTNQVGYVYSFRTDGKLVVADAFRKLKLA